MFRIMLSMSGMTWLVNVSSMSETESMIWSSLSDTAFSAFVIADISRLSMVSAVREEIFLTSVFSLSSLLSASETSFVLLMSRDLIYSSTASIFC